MFTFSLMKRIKGGFEQIVQCIKSENIVAAISEMEKVGALTAQYSQKRANQVYDLMDKTWDVMCHVENRVPSAFKKFSDQVATMYALIVSDHLYEHDRTYKSLVDDSTSIINYARRNSNHAFILAEQLAQTFKTYSFKHGSNYAYYVSGLDEDSRGYKRLDDLTDEYSAQVMKIAILDFMKKI